MKEASRKKVVPVGCVALMFASCVLAQDWPQWRGPNRDGKLISFTAPQKWPAELTQKWTVTVGSGDASPPLVGDRLYVFARQGEEEVTLCLNAANGKKLWMDKYAAQAGQIRGASCDRSGIPAPRTEKFTRSGRREGRYVGCGRNRFLSGGHHRQARLAQGPVPQDRTQVLRALLPDHR